MCGVMFSLVILSKATVGLLMKGGMGFVGLPGFMNSVFPSQRMFELCECPYTSTLKLFFAAISRIFPFPKSVPGSCVTPIFQSKILTELSLGSFPLMSGPSMFPETANTGAACSSSSITERSTRSPAWIM